MYDKYLIVGEYFKNVVKDGKTIGFQIGIRVPYYRGVVLSLVGESIITVDGETFPQDKLTVEINGKTLPKTAFATEPVHKWEFGDIGIYTVEKPGGLSAGEHQVSLRQEMKISYVPGGFWGDDSKKLTIG